MSALSPGTGRVEPTSVSVALSSRVEGTTLYTPATTQGRRCMLRRFMRTAENHMEQARQALTIIDNRTGRKYEIPIESNTIRAIDLRQIKTSAEDFGLMTYDPAFTNTAACKSRITFIDGEKGILWYRGYPIEELAEKSNYLETSYLL